MESYASVFCSTQHFQDETVMPQVIEAFAMAWRLKPDEIFTVDDALGSRSAPFLKVSTQYPLSKDSSCKYRTCRC